jgi:hypothetical protein
MTSYRPFRRELQQARREGTRDYRESSKRVGSVYDALGRELAPLSGQLTSQIGAISSGLQGQLGQFGDLLGSSVPGVPAGEIAAGTGLFGSIGAGALSELANSQARGVSYNASAQRQGSLEKMTARRNYRQDYQTFLDDIRRERINAARDLPSLMRQRVDELRDRGFDRSMALREFELRAKQAGLDARLAASDLRGQNAWANLIAGLTPAEAARLGMGG